MLFASAVIVSPVFVCRYSFLVSLLDLSYMSDSIEDKDKLILELLARLQHHEALDTRLTRIRDTICTRTPTHLETSLPSSSQPQISGNVTLGLPSPAPTTPVHDSCFDGPLTSESSDAEMDVDVDSSVNRPQGMSFEPINTLCLYVFPSNL